MSALSHPTQSLRASSHGLPGPRPGPLQAEARSPRPDPRPRPRSRRHLQVEAALPQHLLAALPRYPKLPLAVQGPQLERLGLPKQGKHPQGYRPRRRHLLGLPLRCVLTRTARVGSWRTPRRGRRWRAAPGNYITQEARGAEAPSHLMHRRRFPGNFMSVLRSPGSGEARRRLVRKRAFPGNSITQKARGTRGQGAPSCAQARLGRAASRRRGGVWLS